jgi:hypothetical protein
MYYGIHRLVSLYAYEAIAGGTQAVELALSYLAVLHQAEEPRFDTQTALEFSRQHMDTLSGAFSRLIYKR